MAGLHLGNQFVARRGEVGRDNSQLDRTAAVPHRIDLNAANTSNRVGFVLVVGNIAAECFTVDTGVILLTQGVGRVAVLGRNEHRCNLGGFQTVHRLDWQQQAGILVADRAERFGLELVVTCRDFLR